MRELRQSAEGCDTYLSQWEGRATLHWDDGRELALRADPAFAHLVVYTAPGADFRAWNRSATWPTPSTWRRRATRAPACGLAPGERYSASLRMDFQLGKPGAIRR